MSYGLLPTIPSALPPKKLPSCNDPPRSVSCREGNKLPVVPAALGEFQRKGNLRMARPGVEVRDVRDL